MWTGGIHGKDGGIRFAKYVLQLFFLLELIDRLVRNEITGIVFRHLQGTDRALHLLGQSARRRIEGFKICHEIRSIAKMLVLSVL